eukprot:1158990-Pelagomonas_calceolata.AAC.4
MNGKLQQWQKRQKQNNTKLRGTVRSGCRPCAKGYQRGCEGEHRERGRADLRCMRMPACVEASNKQC